MNRLGATYFWKNFRNHETIEKFSKNFEKFSKIFSKKFFERCNLMGDVILSNTSLTDFYLIMTPSSSLSFAEFRWAISLSDTQRNVETPSLLMACWKRLHLQFRPRWTSGRTSKSSNDRKIARMARNSTIFGPNESSRRNLFLEFVSKERNNRKVFEKLR